MTLLASLRAFRRNLVVGAAAACVFASVAGSAGPAGRGRGRVAEAVVVGAIDPGAGEFIRKAIARAEADEYEALVLRLDTPGGLVSTTREIVQAELESSVPIIVYVAPSGARAGSAGVFITLAGHLAAMAPATNIGAAHPVGLGVGGSGKDDDEDGKGGRSEQQVMAEKLENDLAAFAESIAEQRGRNVEWAIRAVRESDSVSATRALELNVIDLVAPDRDALLEAADGRTVKLGAALVPHLLKTKGLPVDELPWSLRERFLHLIGEPNLASMLLSLGVLGILLELYHPGVFVPGIVGAISLLLGVVGMSALPVNVGGVALLVLGLGLIVAELFVTSFGLLGVAGAIAFAAGGVLLVDNTGANFFADRDFGVRASLFVPTALFVAMIAIFVGYKAVDAWRRKPIVGASGLVGEVGEIDVSILPGHVGKVFVHSELWNAVSDSELPRGARVRVVEVSGLTVKVVPA
jgi:membrane-bound serine protease (ClpP class)